MDDAELQAIRAARLQEMQRNSQGGGSAGGSNEGKSVANPNEHLLNQILDSEAKQRLNRVRMVKPERVTAVENYLVRLASSGGIRGKVGEDELVELLDRIAREERKSTATTIQFARREYAEPKNEIAGDDSEDDFFD